MNQERAAQERATRGWTGWRVLAIAGLVTLSACGSRQAAGDARLTDLLLADGAGADGAGADGAGADAARPDAAGPDAARPDAGAADMNLSFPAVLEGVWLIGWSGGMNHFSWIRFSKMPAPSMNKHNAWILDGKAISSNLPLWDFNGKASFWMGAAGNTIYIDLPLPTPVTHGYVFSDFNTTGAGAPKDAILSATVKKQSTLQVLSGYKYPDTWCDPTMTSCKPPW